MNILVCNAGSTSLKLKLYRMPQEAVLAECRIERIADEKGGRFTTGAQRKKKWNACKTRRITGRAFGIFGAAARRGIGRGAG